MSDPTGLQPSSTPRTPSRPEAPAAGMGGVGVGAAAGAVGAKEDTAEPTRVSTPEPSTATVARPARAAQGRAKPVRVRKARLRLARIDPWSVMKTAFLFSIAGGIMFWVATYLTWTVIDASGLFDSINKFVGRLVDNPNDPDKFKLERWISGNKVLGLAALLAFVDVVILTALATLMSFLYNLSASMLGGIEVTLAED